jgi:hypothetical protein
MFCVEVLMQTATPFWSMRPATNATGDENATKDEDADDPNKIMTDSTLSQEGEEVPIESSERISLKHAE